MKILILLALAGISIVTSQRPGGLNCPPGPDGSLRFACPKKSKTTGKATCITEAQMCNGVVDCKGGDDEKQDKCRFWKDTIAQHQALVPRGRTWDYLKNVSIVESDIMLDPDLAEDYIAEGRAETDELCYRCGWFCELTPEVRNKPGYIPVECVGMDCSKC